ncbi:MAG TPA: Ig-like domain-containing protein [Chloroflexia bacterium]|nr:Ig-like domain-containing protein [Chloroflexia bacterium]
MTPNSRHYFKTVAGLLAAAGLIVLAVYAVAALEARVAGALPQAQGMRPGLGPFGTTEENNATAELESLGYVVDAVGSPRRADGTPDRSTVIILMPVQSPSFDPGARMVADPESRKQIWAAFDSAARNFPSVTQIAAGLTWGGYIFLFPTSPSEVAAAAQAGGPDEEFWLGAEREAVALDARTWEEVSGRSFASKDFADADDFDRGLPTTDEPALEGDQVRLQPATAYLPDGSDLPVVATVRTASGEAAPGRQVSFTYTPEGGEAQHVASATTGSDGTARATLDIPDDAGEVVVVAASTDDVGAGASVPVRTGPVEQDAAALEVVSASLSLQGYGMMGMQYPAQGVTGPRPQRATMLAQMAGPRFDMNVRAQILTMAGTLLANMPQLTTAEPVLMFRSAGSAFNLVFRVERAHWDAWMGGPTTEAELWGRVTLARVIDMQTGQPVNTPDFVNKDFADTHEAVSIAVPTSVETRLEQVDGGEQLYTGRIRVPVGASAHDFEVDERTQGAEFAIFRSTDPFEPVYSSAADPGGDTLRDLVLESGQYVLAVQGGAAPTTVRLTYLERLMGARE